MGFQGKVAVLFGVAALLVVGTSAEVLFSIDGPVDPTQGNVVGTTKVKNETHIEFDIELHSVPSSGSGWYNIFRVGQYGFHDQLSLWVHDQADKDGAKYEGWYLRFYDDVDMSVGDEPLVAGNSYHFQMDWTLSQIFVKINGNTVWNGEAKTHPTSDAETVYMSELATSAADVTITNFVISTDLSCWITGYKCQSYDVCWDDGKCGPYERQECGAEDIEELRSEIDDLKNLTQEIHSHLLPSKESAHFVSGKVDGAADLDAHSMKWTLTGKDMTIIALLMLNLVIMATLVVVCRTGSGGKYVYGQ